MPSDHVGPTTPPLLDVDAILRDPEIKIVVCCGSGGVGKTTTAAAIALRAAERYGRRAVVLTIDPARRLAQSLGLNELDNTPRQVKGVPAARDKDDPGAAREPDPRGHDKTDVDAGAARAPGARGHDGELYAMMLDMKRTFDEVVLAHTDPRKAEEIFANPFYQAMSATFAGTQEYMAMEKLSQLRATDEWDLIVVDTPPSRSALDFLDAPARLGRFLDGKMLRLLLAPAMAGGRSVFSLVSASFGIFSRAVTKIIGAQLLADLSGFVASIDSMFGGFRDRAEQTYRVLQAPETAFLVVASPEPDAIREAVYFAGRLAEDRMPLAGLVLNRVVNVAAPAISAATARQAAADLAARASADPASPPPADATPPAGVDRASTEAAGCDSSDPSENGLMIDLLSLHASLAEQQERQRAVTGYFFRTHPTVPVAMIANRPTDVHDLDDLRLVGASVAAQRA